MKIIGRLTCMLLFSTIGAVALDRNGIDSAAQAAVISMAYFFVGFISAELFE